MRVKSFTECPADIDAYGPVETEAGDRRFRVSVIGEVKGVVTARLDGVESRDAAEALKGTRLMIERAALPQPEEEEYYASDLVGLRAEGVDGADLGRVKAVFDFGAGDVVEIEAPSGAVVVPFTRAVVPVVDIAGGRIVVDPPAVIEGDRSEGADGE